MPDMPFDLHALQAFVAVCEGGSMIEAARKLGVTQSAISQLIKSLETQSGMVLLDGSFALPARRRPAACSWSWRRICWSTRSASTSA
jgi:hypothetical protein